MFKKVDPKQDFVKLEHEVQKFWDENKTFSKYQVKNKGKKTWSFLDGPITANNPMGVHHAWGRSLKDLFQRYKTMQGFDQRYQNGFDCQGLWVEVEVEKELGFKSKKDIENYGVEKFVQKCKERVKKYSGIQTEQSKRLAEWMDWDNSYYTMSDENNYAIWHFLKKCKEKDYLYKGVDSVPWCPRCGTALSQHEISEGGYKDLTHKSVYFKLPIIERKGEQFLVWTTTPWTIPANVAVALSPELEYGVYEKDGEKLIMCVALKEKVLGKDWKEIEKMKGDKLEKLHYAGPFDDLERVQKAKAENPDTFHSSVLSKELVTATDGTGIVHIAPGCGAEDFVLGKEKKLPVLAVIDEAANYLNGLGEFTKQNAKNNPEIILDYLKKQEKHLFKLASFTHRYPICWRCKEELVWRVVDEWYISMDEPRKDMMEVAKKIKWIPEFGLARELDWLKNMHDWMISKKRYWGLTLPIWECSCGNFDVIGSKEELRERAVEGWEEFEGNTPHKPWVDKVKIECSKCGKTISRIPDVGNPWLDAGIVPFSTMKYFEDKEYWKKWFPADLVLECFPGQFRNWFYALIAMSTVLENTNPYRTLLGHSLVKDEQGKEMHKSAGNAIWFDDGAEKMGVDVMRWMYAKQNPTQNMLFGYNVADENRKKILLLWNVYSFFVTYAEIDEFDPNKVVLDKNKLSKLDSYILSELNLLIQKSEKNLDNYSVHIAMQDTEAFVEKLANWYVRRSRRRFWKSENDGDKMVAYSTLYTVLFTLVKLLAPFVPFLTESMYQNLKSKKDPESVHLCDFPKADKSLIDEDLSKEMNQVIEIVGLARAVREKNNIGVRQPLSELLVFGCKLSSEATATISSELNVKLVKFEEDFTKADEFAVKKVALNFRKVGRKLKDKLPVVKKAMETGGYELKEGLLEVMGEKLDSSEFFETWDAKKGYGVESFDKLMVALNLEITDALKTEGLARDIVRVIQDMRKAANFNVDDKIYVSWTTKDAEVVKAFEDHSEYIAKETLAKDILKTDTTDRFSPEFDKQVQFKTKEKAIVVFGVKR